MLELPNTRFDPKDMDRLADWAELRCLMRDPSELSDGDIADVFHGSMLFDHLVAPGETKQSCAGRIAQELLAALKRRERRLGTAYPFDVDTTFIRTKGNWYEWLCYTSLLAA